MIALGTFPTNSNPLNAPRVFYTPPPIPTRCGTPGTRCGSTAPPPPTIVSVRPPLPKPPMAVPDPIIDWMPIKPPPTFGFPTNIGDPAPSAPTVPSGTADNSTPGSSGAGDGSKDDLSRLLDLFGGSFAPKEYDPGLAPTSVVQTGTSDGASSGGVSPVVIIVFLLLAGGAWWYMKKHKGAA